MGNITNILRPAGVLFIAIGLVFILSGVANAGPEENPNNVAYWCGSEDLGVKYENEVELNPFTVPEGNWSLLVVKPGNEGNFTYVNPQPGEQYSSPVQQAISHVILCFGEETTTSTITVRTAPTTTVPETTTTDTVITTTTAPVTTTTQPVITTTTAPITTTTEPVTTTTESDTTTTQPVITTTTAPITTTTSGETTTTSGETTTTQPIITTTTTEPEDEVTTTTVPETECCEEETTTTVVVTTTTTEQASTTTTQPVTTTTAPELPETGGESGGTALIGLGLFFGGLTLLVVTRRAKTEGS